MSSLRCIPRTSTQRIVPLFATAALALALPCAAQTRPNLPPGGSNWTPQTGLLPGGLFTQDLGAGGQTPAGLVQALIGTGVSVTNVHYTGAPIAAGTFANGSGIIGFAQGILLSTGNIASVVGFQNVAPGTSTDNSRPGDLALDTLVGGQTQDAAVLEFDFSCPTTNVISFQYVFASEEYNEFVNTEFNDVFAFFLNGQNIALVPATTLPVTVSNVNCGNPYSPPSGSNCSLFISNDCDSFGLGWPCTLLATEMDGLTTVLSATGVMQPGTNHVKIAIADRLDAHLDSNVFIRGQSFVCADPVPAFDPPSPCGQTLDVGVGMHLAFEMEVLATNGQPGAAVTLSVTGDALALAGGAFTPPLPAGPAPSVRTRFDWSPSSAEVGTFLLHFTATDQMGLSSTCDVNITVSAPGAAFCFGDGTFVDHTTPCPCGNSGAAGHGCANSIDPAGARLAARGSTAADTVQLASSGAPGTAYTLFVQHDASGDAVFHDGVLCAGGTLVRLRGRGALGGEASFPDPLYDSSLTLSQHGGVVPGSGALRHYAAWYRNASTTFCPPATANVTNGYTIVW